MDLYELNNNLEHNQNIPNIHILFSLHLQKNKVGFKNGSVCYQSLNVQQEPLTDQILKKINTGCLNLYELNNNLEHNQNIPEIHILFSLHLQKKKSGSKMDLLSISKCPARAFNKSKYCRKSYKDVWIYMSFTTILNIIKTSPKYIYFFHFIHKKKKIGFKNGSVINL